MQAQKNSLVGVQKGSKVLVFDQTGTLLRADLVRRVTKTEAAIGRFAERYKITTGKEVGGNKFAMLTGDEEFSQAEETIRQRQEESSQAAKDRLQREYDALPEVVKLARILACFCDSRPQSEIAELPIDALRSSAEWIKANYDMRTMERLK